MESKKHRNKTYRGHAEMLWELLDDIDSILQIIRPSTPEELAKLNALILKKLKKRHEVFHYDGFKLYDFDEWEKKTRKNQDKLESFLEKYEDDTPPRSGSQLKRLD